MNSEIFLLTENIIKFTSYNRVTIPEKSSDGRSGLKGGKKKTDQDFMTGTICSESGEKRNLRSASAEYAGKIRKGSKGYVSAAEQIKQIGGI